MITSDANAGEDGGGDSAVKEGAGEDDICGRLYSPKDLKIVMIMIISDKEIGRVSGKNGLLINKSTLVLVYHVLSHENRTLVKSY